MDEAELDTIPPAAARSPDRQRSRSVIEETGSPGPGTQQKPARWRSWIAPALIVVVSVAHGAAIWFGMGGREGLTNGWPLWRDDHPLYYHSALVTRAFLRDSWTTAGYDPYFMAGYAKSVVYPSSSTLPELAVACFGGEHPDFAYKLYVLISAAAVPWLFVMACFVWKIPRRGTAIAVLLWLIYVWTDFPIRYVQLGMVPYFLGIPLALAATGLFARFLEQGGAVKWLLAAVSLSLAVLVHLTTAMVAAYEQLRSLISRARGSGRNRVRSPLRHQVTARDTSLSG